ncbi:MAG: isocitrate lyase/phosphoenolpyruvate mutase family protein [Chloroflexi bacterium]|nr:isocitrate lyase/phosphoenolpyruvate mutase family protein [Chloroflexota bacterium]
MGETRSWTGRRDRFRELHAEGVFVMPNPMDVGAARLLASMGFPALATTSSGHAASLGRSDYRIRRDEMLAHVAVMTASVAVPFNVDSERCFAGDPAGVAETVELIAAAGAAGCSLEDFDPVTGAIDLLETAVERVGAAARAARRHGVVLTARAENHLHGIDDLDDMIARLRAYRDAGADVVYAPGLTDAGQIRRLVEAVAVPVNVLALQSGPSVPELGALGVRRISTGGALARAAYGAIHAAARELLAVGTSTYLEGTITWPDLQAAFGAGAAPDAWPRVR